MQTKGTKIHMTSSCDLDIRTKFHQAKCSGSRVIGYRVGKRDRNVARV